LVVVAVAVLAAGAVAADLTRPYIADSPEISALGWVYFSWETKGEGGEPAVGRGDLFPGRGRCRRRRWCSSRSLAIQNTTNTNHLSIGPCIGLAVRAAWSAAAALIGGLLLRLRDA